MDTKLKDDRWCFACGSQNPRGLGLSDIHLEGTECVCTFTPQKSHQGWAGIVHGGIASTLLDEIMTHVLWRRGFDAVTAEITVRLKQPLKVGEQVAVRGRIVRLRGKLAQTAGELSVADGTVAAQATAKFIVSARGPDEPGGRLSLAARHAVIFDLFGTLVPAFDRVSYDRVQREMAAAIGMEAAAFTAAFLADAPRRTQGHWPDLESNIADIAARAGLHPPREAIEQAAQRRVELTRRSLMNPYPDALAALRALRAAGRPVGLISDCSPETPILWPACPLAELIPEPIFSASVGIRKPDPRVYHMACERMGISPYEAVFVGDGDSDEHAGARAVGICPILIDRGETSVFRQGLSRAVDILVRDTTEVLALVGVEESA